MNTDKKEPQELNPKQKEFCKQYIVDSNGAKAAIRAGYSEATAPQIASRLLTKVNIKAEIDIQKAKRDERTEVTIDYVLVGLKEVLERCLQRKPVMKYNKADKTYEQVTDKDGQGVWTFDASGANRALELVGKYLKMFTENVNMGGDITVYFDDIPPEMRGKGNGKQVKTDEGAEG